MNGLKKTGAILLLSGLLQFASLSTAFCSGMEYKITADQLMRLETELTTLEENNSRLLSLLTESEMDLQAAQNESSELKNELTKAAKELQALKRQLVTLREESTNASTSLRIANEELKAASESLKKSKNKQERIERQRNIWEIIAGVLAVYAATK